MHGIGSLKTYLFGHVHISTNNYEYEGEFNDGAITGKGIFNWSNGDSYTGDVLNGRLHGRGIFYYNSSCIYEDSGCTYEGMWRNNCKHGTGIYYYASGDTYDGEWRNGTKEGKGVFRNKDRKIIYDGEWKDDNKTGYGILYNLEDETKIEGYFYNGISVNEFVYEFNREHGTEFTNWEYDKFLTYTEKTKLEVADALDNAAHEDVTYTEEDVTYTEEEDDAYAEDEDDAYAEEKDFKCTDYYIEEEYYSEEENELLMSMPLRDMTDKEIERYIDMLGREPYDECIEWERDFNGGAITRYSYMNFDETTITNRWVFNITIRRAKFSGCTIKNFQFEQVHFHECDFMSVILENVTFKDCQFTECKLDMCMSLDNSCSVENFDYEEEMRQSKLEDQVVYRYC
jgi:hypothetical protein